MLWERRRWEVAGRMDAASGTRFSLSLSLSHTHIHTHTHMHTHATKRLREGTDTHTLPTFLLLLLLLDMSLKPPKLIPQGGGSHVARPGDHPGTLACNATRNTAVTTRFLRASA